jgi:hypothetical protein
MAILLELAPEFLLFCTMIFALLALEGYQVSFHPVFLAIAWLLDQVRVHVPGIGGIGPGSWLAKQVRRFDHWILHLLSEAVIQTEREMVLLFHGTADLAQWMGLEIAGLAKDTADAFGRVEGVKLPNLRRLVLGLIGGLLVAFRRRLLKLLLHPLHTLQRLVSTVRHTVAVLEHDLGRWRGYTAKQLRALLRRLAHLGWIAGVASIAALGHLILKRLHLKWLFGYRTLAAFGVAILAKLGIDFVRCNNVGKAGKGVCGMDESLLDELLLGLGLVLGAASLRDFTHDLQDVTDEAMGIVRTFVREPF